ncbi:Protein kintoun [Eumeta japonica]|uniref:Protein kintoun n=1 Tax=Eumeta variegata TaxID=151549 RepID=A0A4C1UQT0_EUMVA|nr:Protein kintoun [Eumeta japonica]
MATGVKPRDDDLQITKKDIEILEDAMKNKQFRELLVEYCEEVRDPANQALYQKEMTELEKERGYDITFINPKEGYVIKTSVAGDKKAFINICSNENICKPSYKVKVVNGNKGLDWKIPYSVIPPRYDFDNKKEKCVIYDVVFHPDALRMAEVNKRFRELVNKTAFDGLKEAFNIDLDNNNYRFPKSFYKGMSAPAVIRKEDPNYKPNNPSSDDEMSNLTPDVLEQLYPQHSYTQSTQSNVIKDKKESKEEPNSFQCTDGYTIPKYVIKQQKNVDLQDFTNDRNCKQFTTIPSKIIVEINLPLLSSTKDCNLDVLEKSLSLISEKPAKYKLNIQLPYSVNEQCGNAQFDKTKRVLTVTLPVIRKTYSSDFVNSKIDSGVDSEDYSGSQSDEDASEKLVTEISSPAASQVSTPAVLEDKEQESFLSPSIGYTLPPYTHNVLDDMVAFTFHVKNTEPDSVAVLSKNSSVQIKFTSIGSGFTPVHYSALIVFNEGVGFHNVSGEAWDNNVILQMELSGNVPQKYQIGLDENSLICEHLGVPIITKTVASNEDIARKSVESIDEPHSTVVEVTNLGTETNIVVTSNKLKEFNNGLDQVDEADHNDEPETPTSPKLKGFVLNDVNENCTKGILRKSIRIARSLSESSVDIASSVDYFSSDCIPEESSLKKTVRFNDVIARQFYRYNSSIEGQKKKNQRKKSKKRNQERRKSESEAEDDAPFNKTGGCETKLKSALKQRRDSGLADTSDAEVEFKSSMDSPIFEDLSKTPEDSVFCAAMNSEQNTIESVDRKIGENKNSSLIRETKTAAKVTNSANKALNATTKKSNPITCKDIKHSSDFYDPDKLNKGQYLEVKFKNDLIFDLDM